MNNHDIIGTMLLYLADAGETERLTWEDLEQAMRLRIDERSVEADAFIHWALDATELRVFG